MIVNLCWIYFIYCLVNCGSGEIITQLVPQAIQIKEYQNTSFSCYSLNRSVNALRYQWDVNNNPFLNVINSIDCTNLNLGHPNLPNNSYLGFCDNQTHSSLLMTNISRTVKNISCSIVTNTMVFSSEESYIHVLYPPIVMKMPDISAIVESRLSIKCNATVGNPSNTTFIWTKNVGTSSSSGEELVLGNISRSDAALYTCTVNNTMTPTYGESSYGHDSGSFYLDVLFSPEFTHHLRNSSVLEGDNFTVTCKASVGNPQETFYNWTRNGFYISNTIILEIPKVKRGDDSIYACTIFNIMTPTDGGTVIMPKTSDFHLDVLFKAKVTKLLANDKTGELIISKGNSLLIECSAEGNPVADTLLYRTIQTDSDIVILTSMYHNVMNASYMDAGIYVCIGRNNYTIGDSSRREMTVIVKGPPRPYPDISNITKVYAALHGTAHLYFKAHPYLDVIGTTRFIWYNGTSRLHADDLRVKILTNYIQSVVIITDIVESDFGKYWVEVINTVGTYSHFFELLERESDISQVQEATSGGLVIGIALAGVVFGAGLITSLWFFHRRYHKRKANTNRRMKYYANVETVVNETGQHGEGGVRFYDRVLPIEDRGTVEKHELTYETLNTTEAPRSESKPVYSNLNL